MHDSSRMRVAIVEDDSVFRAHLAALVGGAPGFACAGAHGSAESMLKMLSSERPDVVLLDIQLPGMSGLQCLREIKVSCPRIEVVMLTISDDAQTLFEALECGATGYLQKPPASSAEVLEALLEVRNGGSPMSSQIARLVVKSFQSRSGGRRDLEQLTAREHEVLALLSRGLVNKEIAGELEVKPSTVATHIRCVYEKLHVHTRAAAAAAFTRQAGRP